MGLTVLPEILRSLPQEDYGTFAFALAVQGWVLASTGLRTLEGAKRGLAQGLDGTLLFALKKRLLVLLIGCVIGLGLIGAFYLITDSEDAARLAVIGILLAPALLLPEAVEAYLVAKRRFGSVAAYRITRNLTVPLGSAAAAIYTGDIFIFALAQWVIPGVIGGIFLATVIAREHLIAAYRKGQYDPDCYRYGLKLIPTDLVTITANKSSHLFMGEFIGYRALGVFAVSWKLREQSARILRFPRQLLYSDYAQQPLKTILRKLWKILGLTFLVGTLIGGLAALAGYAYVTWLLEPEYHEAWIFFAILSAGLPAVLAGAVVQTAFEAHLRSREMSIAFLCADLFKLVAIIAACVLKDIYLVAIAEVLTNWIRTTIFLVLLRKHLVHKTNEETITT